MCIARALRTFLSVSILISMIACGSRPPPHPRFATVEHLVLAQMKAEHIVGLSLAVFRNEKRVYLENFGIADRRTRSHVGASTVFNYGSLTKSFTAAAILRLAAQHKLNLEDRVTRFFPGLRNLNELAIRDLLEQRSGLPQSVNRSEFTYGSSGISRSSALLRQLSRLQLRLRPGRHWDYNNLNYLLLGIIIERASRRTYDEYVRAALLEPAGIRSIAIRLNAATDVAKGYDCSDGAQRAVSRRREYGFAAGGLSGTADDAARWYAALAFGGLRDPLGRALFVPRVDLKDGSAYGYGQFVTRGPQRLYWHTGFIDGFSAAELISPKQGLTVVVLTNCGHLNALRLARSVLDVFLLTPT
jgi:D-alanyl-D-alanine carboxypeptidase